jgi:4-hydroxy-4-methyl-2-oxoglutarate aldolase
MAINLTAGADPGTHNTATLYDAGRRLGLEIALQGVAPMVRNARVTGPAYTVSFAAADQARKSSLNFYDIIASAPKGHILTVQVGADRWAFGANTSRFAELAGMAGIVLDGCVRDIAAVRARDYPIFARGAAVTGYPGALVLNAVGDEIVCGGIAIAPADIIVGDEDGVVSLPRSRLQEILYEAEEIARLDAKLESDIEARRPLPELHATRTQWSVRRAPPLK